MSLCITLWIHLMWILCHYLIKKSWSSSKCGFHQGFEFLELAEYFIFVLHEVNPCIPRKVINKLNIVHTYPLSEVDDIGLHTSKWMISKIPFSFLSLLGNVFFVYFPFAHPLQTPSSFYCISRRPSVSFVPRNLFPKWLFA